MGTLKCRRLAWLSLSYGPPKDKQEMIALIRSAADIRELEFVISVPLWHFHVKRGAEDCVRAALNREWNEKQYLPARVKQIARYYILTIHFMVLDPLANYRVVGVRTIANTCEFGSACFGFPSELIVAQPL